MGLFSKKEAKKEVVVETGPCAICGENLPQNPYTFEGQQICYKCHDVAENLPEAVRDNATIEVVKEYRVFRERNAQLKQQFQVTRKIDFGWFEEKFMFDTVNHLLCFDKKLKKPIYEGCQVKSFEIREDDAPLFRGSAEGLICYTSTVPERVRAMEPQILQLRMQADMRREMERVMEQRQRENGSTEIHSLPTVSVPVLFQKFFVEIHFDHPYWPLFTADKNGPRFSDTEPDANGFLTSYKEGVQLMEELARSLMEVAFPGAPEQTVASSGVTMVNGGGVSVPGLAVDTVAEIQRFKDLMDKGIITEEEFTAKKRQLLDIPL